MVVKVPPSSNLSPFINSYSFMLFMPKLSFRNTSFYQESNTHKYIDWISLSHLLLLPVSCSSGRRDHRTFTSLRACATIAVHLYWRHQVGGTLLRNPAQRIFFLACGRRARRREKFRTIRVLKMLLRERSLFLLLDFAYFVYRKCNANLGNSRPPPIPLIF